jgi:hypothetical protein
MIKKVKSGKIKRHRFRKQLGVKQGFGKPWSAPSVKFRVEFNWVNDNGSEENEQIHWIECRQFLGKERKFLKTHYDISTEEWTEKETIESKFVCVYVAKFLAENKDRLHLNQAFVYATPKVGNDTIRQPIYIIQWSPDLEAGIGTDINIDIVLQNSIFHDYASIRSQQTTLLN